MRILAQRAIVRTMSHQAKPPPRASQHGSPHGTRSVAQVFLDDTLVSVRLEKRMRLAYHSPLATRKKRGRGGKVANAT
jgi:hypothetical protein